MKNLFNQLISRENTDSVKWDLNEKLFGRKDILPMWVADMDIPTPQFIIEAMRERLSHPFFGYTFRSDKHLQSIVEWHARRHNWLFSKEEICFCPGVVPGINMLVLAFTQINDPIIIQPPVYPPFFDAVIKNKRQLLLNPLILENDTYRMDYDNLEIQMKKGAKILILSNPHNPVGRAWHKDELLQLTTLCKKYDVLIISDEIHCDLVLPGFKHTPTCLADPSYQKKIISAVAASKTFNIAGLATSYLIISDTQLRETYLNMLDTIHVGGGNIMGAIATEAAYTHGDEWLNGLMKHIYNNIQFAFKKLEPYQDKVKITPMEATFLLWIDCSGLNIEANRLHHFMINQAKLGLNRGLDFGAEGKSFVRMNAACPTETLNEGLNRLIKAISIL